MTTILSDQENIFENKIFFRKLFDHPEGEEFGRIITFIFKSLHIIIQIILPWKLNTLKLLLFLYSLYNKKIQIKYFNGLPYFSQKLFSSVASYR